MWAYSAPPWRLKSRPGWDLLIHALFVLTWPYAVCLWLSNATWTTLDSILIAGCFLVSLNSQLNQQIRDFEVDSRTDTNFTTRFGLSRSILFLKASTIAVIVLFLLAIITGNIPWLLLPFGLGLLPSFAHYLQHSFDHTNRILPRRIVYVFMILAIIYAGALMVFAGS
jgi:4-hydroxybenzoate polyprenyltransferase